ncbi:hypothetical protein Zm00014a_037093 [Zea mays]|uniref:Uncharacterized protein n=2 Tax=Zea mays TaxID=4577 RepID=A0A3L6DYV4_MAIZE|nr:hypothetical protein Zm00014a_037092 [Zea mays]PWZ13254.1 hypothetical protein Zm00014a_037093 [Zea mays]
MNLPWLERNEGRFRRG